MKTLLKNLLRILLILFLIWCFGGLSVLMLNDIPLLITLIIGSILFVLPIHRHLWRPRKWWMKLIWRLTWKLGVIAGIFLSIIYVIPPFPIAKHTTYLTEPRSTKHYGIDYMAVIEKQLDPGVPPSETGLRVLAETFGRSFFRHPIEDDDWNRFCRILDLPPDFEPKLTYVRLEDFAEKLDEELYEHMQTLPNEERWALEENENIEYTKNKNLAYKLSEWNWSDVLADDEEAQSLVRRWLDENDATLDIFAVILEKPILHASATFHDFWFSWICDEFYKYRGMARNLQIRIQHRLAIGETDKAWDDVLTLYRLADRHRQTVCNCFTMSDAWWCMQEANVSAEMVLRRSEWTAGEIRQKIEEIASFPRRPFSDEDARAILLGDRLNNLNWLQQAANEDPGFLDWYERRVAMRVCRIGNYMIEENRCYDEAERRLSEEIEEPEAGLTGWPLLRKVIVWHGPVFIAVSMRSYVINHLSLYPDGVESPLLRFKGYQIDISLTRLVFLLEAHRREHGNYPETLDALGDDPLLDPCSGKPFRYVMKPAEDGTPGFLLYSVGRNGIDDGGRGWNDKPEGDDIHRQVPPRVYAEEEEEE